MSVIDTAPAQPVLVLAHDRATAAQYLRGVPDSAWRYVATVNDVHGLDGRHAYVVLDRQAIPSSRLPVLRALRDGHDEVDLLDVALGPVAP